MMDATVPHTVLDGAVNDLRLRLQSGTGLYVRPLARFFPMNYVLIAFLSLLLTPFPALALDAAKGFETASINIGYLRQEDFGERVTVQDTADYIKRLQAACAEFLADATTPEDLSIVVAIKPGKRSKVWFVSSRAATASEGRDNLRKRLEAVPPPAARGGPVAFAIEGRVAGGRTKGETKAGPPPTPKEWQDALSKLTEPTLLDGLLSRIWPD